MSQPVYSNIYTINDISMINLISDSSILVNTISTSGSYLPPILPKIYDSYYEFVLQNNEKRVLILNDILRESDINNITNNNKSLLREVYISNQCKTIQENCFKDCSNLFLISYNNNINVSLETIENSVFENCINLIECKLFDINNLIVSIGDYAFKNCKKLYQIQLENSQITSLGNKAFYNCNDLVTIHIPSSLTYIGSECFADTSLVNIYFDSTIPSEISDNIFGNQLPENAVCYYNSNFISESSYNTLKNLFPNGGSNIFFIETNNITIDIVEPFYLITNNNNSVTQSIIDKATEILDSLIIKATTNLVNINVDYDTDLTGTNTLGYANWNTKIIRLNPSNDTGNDIELNNRTMSLNSVVLIHEILHIFGYGAGTMWDNLSNYDTALDFYFTGKNAIYQYNKVLFKNNYKKKLQYVTREDSGGSGTMGSHLEEGFFINEGYFNPQMRADGEGNVYPSIRYEIMSGYLNSKNYFTKISCGVLQDLGYTINYNSEWIYDNVLDFYPAVLYDRETEITDPLITNNLKNDSNSNLKIKCNCNCHENNVFMSKIEKL